MGRHRHPIRPLSLLSLTVLLAGAGALGAEPVEDAFTGPKLDPAWTVDLSKDAKQAAAETGPEGLLLRGEPGRHVLVKRPAGADGSDEAPLIVSSCVQSDAGFAFWPGLHMYWDRENYLSLCFDGNRTLYLDLCVKGKLERRNFENIVDGVKDTGAYVKFVLTSRNVFPFVSENGALWRPLTDVGFRPAGAPKWVLLGRGWNGDDTAKGVEFANDKPNGDKAVVSRFSDFVLSSGAVPLPAEGGKFETLASWNLTLDAYQGGGVPKAWTLLGPRKFDCYDLKGGLPPDRTDDWTTTPPDETGKPFRVATWERPEEEAGCYVELAEILDPDSNVMAYARAEIESETGGLALLWFDSDGPCTVFFNGRMVLSTNPDRRYGNAYADHQCVPVRMRKGKNYLKIKSGQKSGPWGFFARVERSDPGFRIRLLEHLLAAFPAQAARDEGGEAMLEIARQHEARHDFRAAAAAFRRAAEGFPGDDEFRVRGMEGELRIHEMLMDWTALKQAGERCLMAAGNGLGAERALRAFVLGSAKEGKGIDDAISARAEAWLKEAGAGSARVVHVYRLLAGIADGLGDGNRQIDLQLKLADDARVLPWEQALAGLEAAGAILHGEHLRATREGGAFKPDAARYARAAQAYAAALSRLPGGANPQARRLAEEAAADLKAGNHERALGGYWGACLLALSASYPDAQDLLALSRAYAEPDTKENDVNKVRAVYEEEIYNKSSSVKWLDVWYGVGSFNDLGGTGMCTEHPPERGVDLKAPVKTAEGDKKWVALDDAKDWEDGGGKLQAVLGKSKDRLIYLTREFEAAQDGEMTMFFSMPGAWAAWIDGRLIGRSNWGNLQVDGLRRKVTLAKGRHRLLLKFAGHQNAGWTFRVRFGSEPYIPIKLLALAWAQRRFPQAAGWYNLPGAATWMVEAYGRGSGAEVLYALGEATATLAASREDLRWNAIWRAQYYLRDQGASVPTVSFCRTMLDRMETWNDSQVASRAWELTNAIYDKSRDAGEEGWADALLRTSTARYPSVAGSAAAALIYRGALRQDLALSHASRPFFDRAVHEYADVKIARDYGPNGLLFFRSYRPERLLFETLSDVQSRVQDAPRSLQTGEQDDVLRTMRTLGEVLRGEGSSMIRLSGSLFEPRYVGVREYVRSLLASLKSDTLAVYRKIVAADAEQRYEALAEQGNPEDMETLGATYPLTHVAARALNHAGNLYLDRGAYGQATSVFKVLLHDYRDSLDAAGVSPVLVAAKLARAEFLDGQWAEALADARSMAQSMPGQTFPLRGQPVAAEAFAAQIKQAVQQAEKLGDATPDDGAATYAGGPRRAGPPAGGEAPEPKSLAWVRPALQAPSVEQARAWFYPSPFPVLGTYPVLAGGRTFVGTLEGLQALDTRTGAVLWTNSWSSQGALIDRQFTGFPVTCPTCYDGFVYVRALEERRSSLRCYDAEKGRLRWTSETVPSLRQAVWVSDPLIAYGMAIGVFFERTDLNTHGLAALDLRTGALRWKRLLVTGSTGIQAGERYYGSSMQLGPPAAEAGVVYAPTGLGTVVALNAYNGEVVWISGYPRIEIKSDDHGNSRVSSGLQPMRLLRLLTKGPCSPVVAGDTLVVAPKDAAGLIGFDRATGRQRWKLEVLDVRYLAGTSGDKVLVVDDTVKAVDAKTGRLFWAHQLPDTGLFGGPAYAGGALYLPTDQRLQRLDAASGQVLSEYTWDRRTGPLGNLMVSGDRIVGVGENSVAALASHDETAVSLALAEGDRLMRESAWDEAAASYEQVLKAPPTDRGREDVLAALCSRVRALQAQGKAPDAAAGVETALAALPDEASSDNGRWRIKREVLAAELGTRMGKPAPAPAAPSGTLEGAPAFAWQISGEEVAVWDPKDGPSDRFFARVGNDLYQLRLSERLEVLWRTYAGVEGTHVSIGPQAIVLFTSKQLRVIDRGTGQPMWEVLLPADRYRRRARDYGAGFERAAVGPDVVAAVSGSGLYVYDLASGQLLWTNSDNDRYRASNALGFAGGMLVELYGAYEGRNPLQYRGYEVRTGRGLKIANLAEKSHYCGSVVTSDGLTAVMRPDPHRIIAVDLREGKILWSQAVPHFRDRSQPGDLGLSLREPQGGGEQVVEYRGDAYDGPDKGWVTLYLSLKDGRTIQKVTGGGSHWLGDSLVWNSRSDLKRFDIDKGQLKQVWEAKLPGHPNYNNLKGVYLNKNRDRVYLFYVHERESNNVIHATRLRILDWASGQPLQDEDLPGQTIGRRGDVSYAGLVRQCGPLLLYEAREGLFAFAGRGDSRPDVAAKLRESLTREKDAPEAWRSDRLALSAIEPQTREAFLAPADAKVDGSVDEWKVSEPLSLQGPANYVPLGASRKWADPEDCSALVYCGWDQQYVYVTVDVRDDKFAAPANASLHTLGDSLRLAINPDASPRYGIDDNNVLCSMALVGGRTVFQIDQGDNPDIQQRPRAEVRRKPDGKGLNYEIALPWALLRPNPRQRPGEETGLQIGLAVFDDDGSGVEGAVEWGGALTPDTYSPVRLGSLFLLDISREKIARYRQVIEKIPGSAEAWRFMGLILQSHLGAKSEEKRAGELEAFVRAHPDSANTGRALGRLRGLYEKMSEKDAAAKVLAVAQAAKCPKHVVDIAAGRAFRIWVRPDAKQEPRMIMVQFHLRGKGWHRRAYWGQRMVDWSRDGSMAMMRMGDIPAPGQWTQLEIRAVDLDMEDEDIQAFACTTFGGLTHWDRASSFVAGKETVLMDEELPKGFRLEGNDFRWPTDQKQSGAKAWTGGSTTGLLNSHMYAPDAAPWFTFKDPNEPKPAELAVDKQQALYREVAKLIADTPESLTFLVRALDLYTGADAAKKRIDECEQFLAEHPTTSNALPILQRLQGYFGEVGDKDPVGRCEVLMKRCRLPREARRLFYSQFATTWTEWHALGPFLGVGAKWGLDNQMEPEMGEDVDLDWTTNGPGDLRIGWKKIVAEKDLRGNPNKSGVVSLHGYLTAPLDKAVRKEVEDNPNFAYAYRKFNMPERRKALLLYGAQSMLSIWVNGRRVVTEESPGREKDSGATTVTLQSGENRVLIKVAVQGGGPYFYFRIADENGRPFDHLPQK